MLKTELGVSPPPGSPPGFPQEAPTPPLLDSLGMQQLLLPHCWDNTVSCVSIALGPLRAGTYLVEARVREHNTWTVTAWTKEPARSGDLRSLPPLLRPEPFSGECLWLRCRPRAWGLPASQVMEPLFPPGSWLWTKRRVARASGLPWSSHGGSSGEAAGWGERQGQTSCCDESSLVLGGCDGPFGD